MPPKEYSYNIRQFRRRQDLIVYSSNIPKNLAITPDTPTSPNPDDFWFGFAPEQRADLQKSGLLPPIIQAAGLYTASSGEINRLAGFEPHGVHSALVIPDPGIEDPKGKGFYRLRFYPLVQGKNGKERKYH